MRDGRRRLVMLAGVLVFALTGCDALDDAQRVVDRADLVNELAARLDRTEQITYTAEYQLSGGTSGIVAKGREPSRIAYTYPAGKLIMMPDASTDCRGVGAAVRCTVIPVASPTPDPPTALYQELSKNGMIPPPVVVTLLNATALDSDAAVTQRDTTIAGQHATCVSIAGVDNAPAGAFEVCITTDGVIGSFSGTVDGVQIEQALTQYRGTVTAIAFDPPPGATIADRRVAAVGDGGA